MSPNCDKKCSSDDLTIGESHLYLDSNAYNNLLDNCMNDTWATWCCICKHPEYYHYPTICTQYTLSCPIILTTPTSIPIDCVWSEFGTCIKSGTGCIQKRTHLTEALYGGKQCVGPDSQICYPCIDNKSIATPVSRQIDTLQITLSTFSRPKNDIAISPSITQALPQNRGFDLFKQPSPSPFPTQLLREQSATLSEKSTPTQTVQQQPITPSLTSMPPTLVPTPTQILQQEIMTTIPTPTSPLAPTVPPESIIPESLASQQQNVGGGTSYQVDTSKITNISVAPGIVSKSKPILSQEQRLLANNETAPVSSGIMVGLQQKTGSQFVTQQDELTVKRGNQFFSITNQTASAPFAAKIQANKVAANSTKTVEAAPQLEINANNVVAYSSMGLSIDPLSGVLTVETPTGPQKVSIMPDEALGIIIELKALSTGGAEPSILLVSEKGKLIYRITGEKVEKFLGLLPISIQKQVLVSADTGSIITIELSLLSRIMSFFTF